MHFTEKSSVPDNPKHYPNTREGWIELKVSKDVNHTVLPLVDIVPIEVDPPTPIGGIGIFHKGAEGYAGYISLRLYSLQFENDLKEFTEKQKDRLVFADV